MRTNLKVYDNHVAFFGSGFSNFFPCTFVESGIEWISSEQCFMAKKAAFFGDTEMFDAILASKTPKDAKKFGRLVKNFDSDKWSEVCFDKMYEAVYAKFSQNDDLKALILSKEYEGKGFIEGSPFDSIWGVKMDWRNSDIDNEENWKGQNLLGKVINKVREDLLNE
jgi:ribA/ribD-fused uncharacterized protein